MSQIFYVESTKVQIIKDKLSEDFKLNEDYYTPYQFSQRQYEIHKKFVDVQFLLSGFEDLYIASKRNFSENPDYIEENDISFFKSKPKEDLQIHLKPGIFVVIYPNEAHMPCIAPKFKAFPVVKCVAKIHIGDFDKEPSILSKYFDIY